jgi:hypothetical protein
MPLKPFIDAVMVVVPAETAVTSPDELIEATAGALEDHAAKLVTSFVVEGCLPWVVVPVAENCDVWPTARVCAAGLTVIVSTCEAEQPTKKGAMPAITAVKTQRRLNMQISSRARPRRASAVLKSRVFAGIPASRLPFSAAALIAVFPPFSGASAPGVLCRIRAWKD